MKLSNDTGGPQKGSILEKPHSDGSTYSSVEPRTDQFSILEIIFLHYVARSFCETIKLPKEFSNLR